MKESPVFGKDDDVIAKLKELKAKGLVRVREAYTIAELDAMPDIIWQLKCLVREETMARRARKRSPKSHT